ncbi:(d)CMP kinase [Sporichthya brevicatena]|uniref:Cytidylate kinase n=2 Tax=Sporichthya brevicatena TaxID=171442 RepID=A0ABN1H1Z1_9ACTN
METAPIVLAMDGPSGSGKSSVSREVAATLGFRYLDTGAMYRAITWWMLREGVDVDDAETVGALAGKPELLIGTDPTAPTISVDGTDVSAPIRGREVTGAVSAVSAVPAVRARLVAMQQQIIAGTLEQGQGIVVEGRDIGTVVAPEAPVKMFLTASADARASRRTREVLDTGENATVSEMHADMARRDRLDSSRAASPLTQAPDAVLLDTTPLDKDGVVAAVLEQVRRTLLQPVSGTS